MCTQLEELHQKYKLSEGPEVSDMRRSKDRLVDSTFQSSSQAGVSAHFPSNDSLLSDTAKVAGVCGVCLCVSACACA